MNSEQVLLFTIIPFLAIGFLIGKKIPVASQKISIPLINYGIPISVMGLLLKHGIDTDLIKAALIAFITICLLMLLINISPPLKRIFPTYSLQLSGLIGNTSFLGIPIAMALLPSTTIDLTIGFDLGTTFFAWLFGPFLLQNRTQKNTVLNVKQVFFGILNSPASKGIIGVLVIYQFGLESYLGEILWIPAITIIFLMIIVVGTRLGIIVNSKKKIIDFSSGIHNSLILKLLILPLIIFIICSYLNFNRNESAALIIQAGTPTAISTILMAEAYKINQDISAKILFLTTITATFTIPIIRFIFFNNLNY